VIPTLLWRCPICGVNDALVHTRRLIGAERVDCNFCGARWRVRRVPGDNFYLKLVAGGAQCIEVDEEMSITAWYDLMKASLQLIPVDDHELGLPNGEFLYLASGSIEMQAEADDPAFFPAKSDSQSPQMDKAAINPGSLGQGRLYLTDRRLIWGANSGLVSFPLERLNSAYAVVDFGLALMVMTRLYVVHFLEESPLKWVTYLAQVAHQAEAVSGHRIVTSHF
jgi:hypothetical protein